MIKIIDQKITFFSIIKLYIICFILCTREFKSKTVMNAPYIREEKFKKKNIE